MTPRTTEERRSLSSLVTSIPSLVTDLIKAEFSNLQREIVGKLKAVGIGAALFVVAAVIAFFLLGVLIAAAVLGFAEIMPGWAAALTVAGIMIVIIAILVLVGVNRFKKGTPPAPTETIESVKDDVRAIKGMGDAR
jgi:MFS family permease